MQDGFRADLRSRGSIVFSRKYEGFCRSDVLAESEEIDFLLHEVNVSQDGFEVGADTCVRASPANDPS